MTKQELIDAVMSGRQISNYGRWVWQNRDGTFHSECYTPGCCDDEHQTLEDAIDLDDLADWHICPEKI